MQVVEVDDKCGLILVGRIDHQGEAVANLRSAKHLAHSQCIDNLIGHRVATLIGQEHHHRVGTSVTSQSVERGVALGFLHNAICHRVGGYLIALGFATIATTCRNSCNNCGSKYRYK